MKKIASLVGAGALVLGMAIPTFAFGGGWFDWSSSEATVKNYAWVDTNTSTSANTGWNISMKSWFFGGTVETGGAFAGSDISNRVNWNSIGCDCYDDLYVKNFADVDTNTSTSANTGWNDSFGGSVFTGGAEAQGLVSSVVNTNIVGN